MSGKSLSTIIHNKSQLIEYFAEGCKPKESWGIGTEHEKFLCDSSTFKRLNYSDSPGIQEILAHFLNKNWNPIEEKGKLIGLKKDGASITLEPGGQYELSGRNFKNIHQTYKEATEHFNDLKEISDKFNVMNLSIGFDPLWDRDEIDWMPKKRYQFMRNYMPTVGSKGIDMMKRTATIQTNLDYESEQDMVDKMRVAQSIQPIVTAIFANSPFTNGKPNGYQSYRSVVWDYTDADRCGFLPFIFNNDFGFERWVDYLLDIPMYFLYRDGEYVDINHITFDEFLKGKSDYEPLMSDWETHLSTAFPDVRLKQYIELRGADASCCAHIAALSSLWVGLLYHQDSIDEILEYIQPWTLDEVKMVRYMVPKTALRTEFGNINVQQTAEDILKISEKGLDMRAKELNIEDENKYLDPIRKIIQTKRTQSDQLLDEYYNKWNGDIYHLIKNHC